MELGRARAKLATTRTPRRGCSPAPTTSRRSRCVELRDLVRGIDPPVLATAAWTPRSPASPSARRSRSSSGRRRGSGCPPPSRPPPTTSSPRRSRTSAATPARSRRTSTCAANGELRLAIGDDGRGGARAPARLRPGGPRPARRGARRHARRREPAGRPDHDPRGCHACSDRGGPRAAARRDGAAAGRRRPRGRRRGRRRRALLDGAREHRPDLAIVDVRMPPTQTRRGRPRRGRGAPPLARRRDPDPQPVRRGALRVGGAPSGAARRSATYSRTVSPTRTSSSRPRRAWPQAEP